MRVMLCTTRALHTCNAAIPLTRTVNEVVMEWQGILQLLRKMGFHCVIEPACLPEAVYFKYLSQLDI